MAKIFIVASLDSSLVRFRGDMIKSWIASGHEVFAAAPGHTVKSKLKKMGTKYYCLPLKRVGLNPLEDIILLVSLIRLLRTIKPDYLFVYTSKPVIYGSLAAYLLPSCRVFAMITGLGSVYTGAGGRNKLFRCFMTFLYRVSLTRNEKVFFQNPDDLKEFGALKILNPKKAVLVNGSGVELSYYHPTPLPSGPIVFLLIARLLKEKGIYEYLEAARDIKNKYHMVIFRMIGWALEGGPSVISHEQVKQWRQEGFVDIIDKTDDVRPYIAAASVYVLPSYREGTPRTVLEAMSMGRAIITTDAPGCRETVEEGVNGFLVPVQDAEALAKAMEKFILQPELIPQMGAVSRKMAEVKYDVHKVNKVINETMGLT